MNWRTQSIYNTVPSQIINSFCRVHLRGKFLAKPLLAHLDESGVGCGRRGHSVLLLGGGCLAPSGSDEKGKHCEMAGFMGLRVQASKRSLCIPGNKQYYNQ